MPVYPGALESLRLSIAVVQFLFTTLSCLFYKKCNRLKARVVIYAYNHHVRLLSPEPEVVDKPQSTRVKEPTLLRSSSNPHSRHCYAITGQAGCGKRRVVYNAL